MMVPTLMEIFAPELEQWKKEAIESGLQEGIERGMREGRERGMQEGRERGMQEGREQGIQQSIEQIMQRGSDLKLISLICCKLKKGKTAETIADELEEESEVVERICETAVKFAPEYDVEKIYGAL